MALLTLLIIFRHPYSGEELYRVTDVMALLTLLIILDVCTQVRSCRVRMSKNN